MKKQTLQLISLAGVFYVLFTATQNEDGTYAVTRAKQLSKDLGKVKGLFPNATIVDGLKGGTNFIGTLTDGVWSFEKVEGGKKTAKGKKTVEAVALEGTPLEAATLVLCRREGATYTTLYTSVREDNTETLTMVKNVSKDHKTAKAMYPTATVDNTLPSGKTIVRQYDDNGQITSALSQTEINKLAKAQAKTQAQPAETADAQEVASDDVEQPTDAVEQEA